MADSAEEFRQTFRIIDASLNRIGEGLRFLEETARMLLNDSEITQQLKSLRHSIVITGSSLQEQLINSREADTDVGADMKSINEPPGKDMKAVLIANSRRVQESLRTLEEIARMPGSPDELNTDKFRQARFLTYTIEKELFSKLLKQDKQNKIRGLYVVIDTELLKGRSHVSVAEQAINGGARIIQLRDKVRGKKQVLETAGGLRKLCSERDVIFIVNDYADIAVAADADGLHLGQDDLPVKEARKILPVDKIIGCSTTGVKQAVAAQESGADYVAVGAIYPTESKLSTTTPAKVIGLDILKEVKQAVSVPVIAIGGINIGNVAEAVGAGADAIAVIGAVLGAESPEEASRMMTSSIEGS
jgi:thiamine-phosphate pyrophosphorylase